MDFKLVTLWWTEELQEEDGPIVAPSKKNPSLETGISGGRELYSGDASPGMYFYQCFSPVREEAPGRSILLNIGQSRFQVN